jgi:simple sugar transport system ATP-binding protein
VSLEVRAGEILGVAGVAGNGQSELAEVITGLRGCEGRVLVEGREVGNRPVIESIESGVAHVPEDRLGTGTAPDLSITDNVIMKRYRLPPVARRWVIDDAAARRIAEELKAGYEVAAPTVDTRARLLSGGNLQRLILARELTPRPRVLVAVQPTRGLDVGAIETVHGLLLAQRDAGTAILLISEDLDEVLALADRIAVMYGGRIAGTMNAAGADVHEIGSLMTGATGTPS